TGVQTCALPIFESHNTKIEQNAQQIQLRATKTEVDTLTGRVNTVESTIQQHADMIESKIDDGQARSIFRQEASSFTFEADQINFKGHVFGEDATFTGHLEGASGTFAGKLTASYLVIGPESPNIPWYEHGVMAVEIKNPVRVTNGVYDWGEPFSLKVGNNEAHFEGVMVT